MWLCNLRIVLPDRTLERGSLRIEEGRIVGIVERYAPNHGGAHVDASGLTALPGAIDMHGDMLERDMEPRPGVYFPVEMALLELDKRLASTGVTTAYAAISFWDNSSRISLRSADRAREIVSAVSALRPSLLVDFRVHARYELTSPSVAPVLEDLIGAGQTHLVSLMDHTPGQGQYRDLARYAETIEKWRLISKEEAEQMTLARMRRAQEITEGWTVADRVAWTAVRAGLLLASHDDDTPEKVDRVMAIGATISEFPVTIEAARHAKRRGMWTAMGAPNVLLGRSTSGNLSALDAIEAGLVDMLVSDYYPAAIIPTVFALTERGVLPLHEAARLVSTNAATALRLAGRGSLAVGNHADLVLVEEGARPRVRATIREGIPIYWDAAMARRSSGLPSLQTV